MRDIIGALARRAVVIAALACVCGAACSDSEAKGPGDGGAGTGGAGTGGSTVWTCQQIRQCVFDCSSDACLQTCVAKGSPDAQEKFEALRACTAQVCNPVTDVNCACGEQCLEGGGCFPQVAACLDGASADLICDSALCH